MQGGVVGREKMKERRERGRKGQMEIRARGGRKEDGKGKKERQKGENTGPPLPRSVYSFSCRFRSTSHCMTNTILLPNVAKVPFFNTFTTYKKYCQLTWLRKKIL